MEIFNQAQLCLGGLKLSLEVETNSLKHVIKYAKRASIFRSLFLKISENVLSLKIHKSQVKKYPFA